MNHCENTHRPRLPDQQHLRAPAREGTGALRGAGLVSQLFVLFAFLMPFDTIREGLFGIAGWFLSPCVVLLMLGLLLFARPAQFISRLPAAFAYFLAYALLYGCWVALFVSDKDVFAFQLYGGELLVAMITLFAVAHAALRDEKCARRALLAFAISCALVSTLVLLGMGGAQVVAETGGRMFVSNTGPNAFAALLGLGIVCSLSYPLRYRGGGSAFVLALLLVLPQALAVIYTGSRGGLVATVAGILALLPLRPRLDRKTLGQLAAFASAAALLLAASGSMAVSRNRWQHTFESGSLAGREAIYPEALHMFLERPLLGWGPYLNLQELSRRLAYPSLLRDTHNDLLWVATEMGLVGLAVLGLGVWLCIRAAITARQRHRDSLPLALLVCSLVAGMSCTNLRSPDLWVVLAYAMASGARHRADTEGAPVIARPAQFRHDAPVRVTSGPQVDPCA